MGIIVDIKRFEIHDGPGIRTTLFLKGCPLKCKWCHNPETIGKDFQLSYVEEKCINCGECINKCNMHNMINGKHIFSPEKCNACGQCIETCLGEALKLYGKEVTVQEILPYLIEDRAFYGDNGGVTISGGEPLMQWEFVKELLHTLKDNHINTAVDTSGYTNRMILDEIIPYTDIFLYDVKAFDEQKHIECTGKSNVQILENLRYLDERGCRIEIRFPLVPEYNDDQVEKIGRFLSDLSNIKSVKVLPYHDYATTKYKSLNLKMEIIKVPTEEQIKKTIELFRKFGLNAMDGRK